MKLANLGESAQRAHTKSVRPVIPRAGFCQVAGSAIRCKITHHPGIANSHADQLPRSQLRARVSTLSGVIGLKLPRLGQSVLLGTGQGFDELDAAEAAADQSPSMAKLAGIGVDGQGTVRIQAVGYAGIDPRLP
jgi:hypothetical protein